MACGKLSAFALFLILTSGVSWAQGARNKEVPIKASAESQAALVRQAFVNEMQSILQKFLKPHQYAVDVQFKLPANAQSIGDVPYAPDSIIAESYQGLPSAAQLKKLQDLKVRILVPQWMEGQTKSTLQSLLARHLEQLMGASVPLELQNVPLNVEEPARPIPGLSSVAGGPAMDNSRQVEELKAQLEKERQQFREELRELQDKIGNQNKTGSGPVAAPASQNAFQSFWEFAKANPVGAGIVLVLIYGGIFTLAFLPSRSMASGLGAIQNAFGAIAKSIKGVADSMARSGSGSSGGDSMERAQAAAVTAAPATSAVATSSKSQQPSYPELKQILQDIQRQHQPHSDPIAIEMLQSFLSQSGQAFKAVLVLELLGPQNANRIFEQLASDQKDQVLRLINHTESAVADKTEALYDLAEAYQTRLLAAGWKGGTRAALNEDLQRTLASLKVDELNLLARQLKTEDGLRRFMLYLDAPSLVKLMQGFKRHPQEKELALRALAAMPEALDAGHADREILGIVQQYLTRKREDRYLPYLAHYETIISQSGEDMEDELIEQISRSNPNIGQQLRRRVVTIGSFFVQSESVRSDLLGPFSNYELAVLLSAFPDEQKKAMIMASIEPQRRELVQEQMHMLVDENKYALMDTQRNLKARLKNGLRVIRANQGDDGVVEVEDEEMPSTPSGAAA